MISARSLPSPFSFTSNRRRLHAFLELSTREREGDGTGSVLLAESRNATLTARQDDRVDPFLRLPVPSLDLSLREDC